MPRYGSSGDFHQQMNEQRECIYARIHTPNGILLSHKKKEIFSFTAPRVDLEGTMLSEIISREVDPGSTESNGLGALPREQTRV